MIEVFKTNVAQPAQAARLLRLLQELYPLSSINFDLEDCDRVLRIEGAQVVPQAVMRLLHSRGYDCQTLEE